MGQLKKETGNMAYFMVKELNIVKMIAQVIKDYIKEDNFMEQDPVILLMELHMKENGRKIKEMDTEPIIWLAELNMQGIGKMILQMAKEF